MKNTTRALAALALLLLPLAAAVALEAPTAIRPTWGVVIESLLDPALNGSVSNPSINFNLGAGVIMPLSPDSRFAFVPSGDFYFGYYEYSPEGQAVPTAQEFGSAFGLGLLLNAPIVYSLPLGGGFTIGLGLGLALDLRVAFTLDPNNGGNTPLMNRYFWDKGRFLTPSTIFRAEYQLTDRVGFGFSGRAFWPVYNLWSGEGYGFLDQGMYLVDITIVYNLGQGGQ